MKAAKKQARVIKALLNIAPPLIDNCTESPNHCIMATAVGIEVLKRFDVPAKPLSVGIQVYNHSFKKWAVAGFPEDKQPEDSYLIEITKQPSDPVKFWAGHLIIQCGRMGIDLNMSQFNRPEKNIKFPSGMLFIPVSNSTYGNPEAGYVNLELKPNDKSWQYGSDWHYRQGRFNVLIQEIIRTMKKSWRKSNG